MGNEAADVRLIPLVLSVVLAMGCTTRVINLAVDDGGADKASVARVDADGASSTDTNLAVDDGGTEKVNVVREDASVDREEPDDASSTHVKEAYDAGWVMGSSHYVEFTCCTVADAPTCIQGWLGGADVCRSVGEWKDRANAHCTSMGLNFTGYGPFGACAP